MAELDFDNVDALEAAVWQALTAGDFALIGPDAWSGTRELTGYSFDPSGRCYGVDLDHRRDSAWLRIETTRRNLIKTEIDIGDRGFRPKGSVLISVDGTDQRLRYFEKSRIKPYTWAAVGFVGALGLGLEVQGLEPSELRLITGVDPMLYRR